MAQILVVDDEVGIRELLSEILADEGHQVLLAESASGRGPTWSCSISGCPTPMASRC
jgi:CheY-like chemotaxis protein